MLFYDVRRTSSLLTFPIRERFSSDLCSRHGPTCIRHRSTSSNFSRYSVFAVGEWLHNILRRPTKQQPIDHTRLGRSFVQSSQQSRRHARPTLPNLLNISRYLHSGGANSFMLSYDVRRYSSLLTIPDWEGVSSDRHSHGVTWIGRAPTSGSRDTSRPVDSNSLMQSTTSDRNVQLEPIPTRKYFNDPRSSHVSNVLDVL
jgi:hypothetical protein